MRSGFWKTSDVALTKHVRNAPTAPNGKAIGPVAPWATLMAVTVLAFLSIGSIAIGKVMLEHAVSKRLLAVDPGQRGAMLVTANMTSPLFVVNVSALNYSDFSIVGVF
ncbi:hypothetical protein MRX96_040248 [Rhipicephalus microplus]